MSSYGPDPGGMTAPSRGMTQCGHAVEKQHCIEGLSGSRRVGWQEEKGMTEDKMVGWHHRLNGHELEQAPGVGDGQRNLACWSPWGLKQSKPLSD